MHAAKDPIAHSLYAAHIGFNIENGIRCTENSTSKKQITVCLTVTLEIIVQRPEVHCFAEDQRMPLTWRRHVLLQQMMAV